EHDDGVRSELEGVLLEAVHGLDARLRRELGQRRHLAAEEHLAAGDGLTDDAPGAHGDAPDDAEDLLDLVAGELPRRDDRDPLREMQRHGLGYSARWRPRAS